MNLLDELLEVGKLVAEGSAPVESLERILHKVACLDVAIHAHVVENVLQIALLVGCQLIAFYKVLIYLQGTLAVDASSHAYEGCHIIFIWSSVRQFLIVGPGAQLLKEYALQFLYICRRQLFEVLYLA